MTEPAYPPAPWHTHGRAFVQSFLVRAADLELPDGFRPVAVAGRCVGILALIEYVAPSPLTYAELTWMPCMVSAGGVRGYYVAKMYVDSPASLAAGRELWALPKQLARFEIGEREATIATEDGAHLELSLARRGPALSLRARASTVQDGGADLVRFRGTGMARTSSGGVTVRAAEGIDGWTGFASARRLPGLGAALSDFAITMLPPLRNDCRRARL
ncbi:MAG: acetoacetate decarboxylase family protein [Polyangiales bacterium]